MTSFESAAGSFLAQRSYQGLDPHAAPASESTAVRTGRTGIAAGYAGADDATAT